LTSAKFLGIMIYGDIINECNRVELSKSHKEVVKLLSTTNSAMKDKGTWGSWTLLSSNTNIINVSIGWAALTPQLTLHNK